MYISICIYRGWTRYRYTYIHIWRFKGALQLKRYRQPSIYLSMYLSMSTHIQICIRYPAQRLHLLPQVDALLSSLFSLYTHTHTSLSINIYINIWLCIRYLAQRFHLLPQVDVLLFSLFLFVHTHTHLSLYQYLHKYMTMHTLPGAAISSAPTSRCTAPARAPPQTRTLWRGPCTWIGVGY